MTILNLFKNHNSSKYKPPVDLTISDEQFNMGIKYEFGYGVNQDFEQAVKWYKKSAEQGHIKAQAYLAWMYYEGVGVAKDYERSLFWYKKAFEQGDKNAKLKFIEISNLINILK